ncbi:cytochrome c oxidase assembly factor 1 homolog isoform X1 [Microcebus murinus]|uniref:cytochrome c oxidase assembly factor 1 homolog isoform X1 n=2 Tax=Microcebus murinus TaxID=30608 RepID=UPI003F6CB3D6
MATRKEGNWHHRGPRAVPSPTPGLQGTGVNARVDMHSGSRMSMSLGKLILFAGVLTSGGSALVYYFVQKAFSRSLYYQLGLEQLHSHPEALEALGTPVNVHNLKLPDKQNFVDIAEAQLKIPVSGSKSEGHLYVFSSRAAPFQRWHLDEVFLQLEDGQKIPVFKLSGENGDEVKKE